jgi:alkylation response protein AidB-like acyl-CoA dehydrogenase
MTDLDAGQGELRELAAGLFRRYGDAARLDKVDASDERFDRELWAALGESGLLGVGIGESHGGLGFGAVEVASVLEQFGRVLPKVPLVASYVLAALIQRHAGADVKAAWLPRLADGSAIAAIAVADRPAGVLWAHVADVVAMADGDDVVLADPRAVPSVRGETTAREIALDLDVDPAAVQPRLPGAAVALRQWWRAALAAVQAGITDAAVRLTADYTSHRNQFGKPLSTFQGVALRAADAFIDATAVHETALKAAWTLDHAADAEIATLTAAWWAAEAGQRCVHATQHLHGGMGADITYPVHRYFLAGKQIELLLGGASALLAELGDALLHDGGLER